MRFTRAAVVYTVLFALVAMVTTGCSPYSAESERSRYYADVLQTRGDLRAAIENYDRAIAQDPSNAHAYNDRGVAKHKLGDTVGAMADFNKGISINPKCGTLYYHRATMKAYKIPVGGTSADLRGKDVDGALADCAKAIELQSSVRSVLEAHLLRGAIFIARGEFSRASSEYKEAARWYADFSGSNVCLGVHHLLDGRDTEAQKYFERAYKATPECRADTEADVNRVRRRMLLRG